jgi:regulator of sigma D
MVKFTNNVDDADEVPNVDAKQPKYRSYKFTDTEWQMLVLIKKVLQVAADIQEEFSAEYYPTVWRIFPLYEQFLAKWRQYANDPDMSEFWPALEAAIESVQKYYNKSDNSPVNIVSLCKFSSQISSSF